MSRALKRFFFSSLSLWLLIGLGGIYFLGNLKKYVNFGIDLVGGTFITLEVQMDKYLENEITERVGQIKKELESQEKGVMLSVKAQKGGIVATFANNLDAQLAESLPLNREKKLALKRDGQTIYYSLSPKEIEHLTRQAVESNINVLRTRVDQFGVGEVAIAAQGEKNIVIELPNVQDVQKAKAMIGTSALLEVKTVIDQGSTQEEILEKYGNEMPDGMEIVSSNRGRGGRGRMFYLVPRYTDLTGKLLKSASPNPAGGQFGMEPAVDFVFSPEGGDKFYELTSKGGLIAMIVDGSVVTAAHAEKPLRDRGQIFGNFTEDEAKELASLLRSGAFTAPVTFEEDRTIAPTLGAESIHRGLIACAIGLAMTFVFSVFVYKIAGLFAFIVLLFNLLLILFVLAWLGAALTLPGIAGMVLTVGMAIDSSILIYERIREELALGRPFKASVSSGFSDAATVIIDANLTTLLVAIVLYKLGVGPIQGFAVTMIIGIIATLITGLVLLKSIFGFVIDGLGVQRIKI